MQCSFFYVRTKNSLYLTFYIKNHICKIFGDRISRISGLFSNILSMLCLADLGVAYALNYSLYKPLAEKNTEKIKSLMWLYKKTFQIIGIVIIILGLFLLPWYKNFMKEIPDIPY